MSEERNFRIKVQLHYFYRDHRSTCRIFINKRMKTIQDVKNHIMNLFSISNFNLLCQNEFIPEEEDVRVLREDDVVILIPINVPAGNLVEVTETPQTTLKVREDIKRKRKNIEMVTSETEESVEQPVKKCKKKKKNKHKREIKIENSTDSGLCSLSTDLNSLFNNCESNNYVENLNQLESTLELQTPKQESFNVIRCTINDLQNAIRTESKNEYDLPTKGHESISPKFQSTKSDSFEISNNKKFIRVLENKTIRSASNNKSELNNTPKLNQTDKNGKYLPVTKLKCKTNVIKNTVSPIVHIKKDSQNTCTEVSDNEPSKEVVVSCQESSNPNFNKFKSVETYSLPEKQNKNIFYESIEDLGNLVKHCESNRSTGNIITIDPRIMKHLSLIQAENIDNDNVNSQSSEHMCLINSQTSTDSKTVYPKIEENLYKTNMIGNDLSDKSHLSHNENLNTSPETSPNNPIIDVSLKTDKPNYHMEPLNNLNSVNNENKLCNNDDAACLNTTRISPISTTNPKTNIAQSEFKSRQHFSTLGIGSLVETLKSDVSQSSIMSESDISLKVDSSFVTKRVRKRVRKRKSKNVLSDDSVIMISSIYKPPNIEAKPLCHIKFDDDAEKTSKSNGNMNESVYEISDCDNSMIKLLEIGNISRSDVDSDILVKTISEDDALKIPIMTSIPRQNETLIFKILKISENYTPTSSGFITGTVVKYNETNSELTLNIIEGNSEFEEPKGKFFLNEEDANEYIVRKQFNNPLRTLKWSELIEPRVLSYPLRSTDVR